MVAPGCREAKNMSKKKRKKPNVRRPAGATAVKSEVAVPAARNADVPSAADQEKPSPNGATDRATVSAPPSPGAGETPTSLGAAETSATQSADRMSTSRCAVDRELALGRAAYELFLAEGGGDLEALMENGQRTAKAYTSQIRAAEEGGQGWGPTVSPYEDRMTRSLQLRLIRERRKWIEDCRERIKTAIEESDVAVSSARNAAVPPAAEGEKPSPNGATGHTTESASTTPSAGETPTSPGADRMSTSRIAEIGERLTEEARAERTMIEEAAIMARKEYERDKRRNLPDSAFPMLEAVSQQAGSKS